MKTENLLAFFDLNHLENFIQNSINRITHVAKPNLVRKIRVRYSGFGLVSVFVIWDSVYIRVRLDPVLELDLTAEQRWGTPGIRHSNSTPTPTPFLEPPLQLQSNSKAISKTPLQLQLHFSTTSLQLQPNSKIIFKMPIQLQLQLSDFFSNSTPTPTPAS
jgi:hypothetical protein